MSLSNSTCSIADCAEPGYCRGWCKRHYHRWYLRGGDPAVILRRQPASCTTPGCDRGPCRARGLCSAHYARLKRGFGNNSPVVRIFGDDLARFESKVRRTATCHEWTGYLDRKGYGIFTVGARKVAAHRWAYERYVGPIPDGLELDHVWARGCRSTACVNPDHLEPVTRAENQRRWAATITHCPHGHEYTPENTYIRPGGVARVCRVCNSAQKKKRAS